MGQQSRELADKLQDFIKSQKLFFVATATATGRINLSPKGMDSLRIIDSRRLAWLNLTGSGNETAAHIRECNRMTLMFCAFEGSPLILRLYGRARVFHPRDAGWRSLYALFDPIPGARQIFDMEIELVQTSCGMGVPRYDYAGDRDELVEWAARKGETGLREYWSRKNRNSLDGEPTYILAPDD